jgi:glycosyltransferase involved in cell wall biosynthesis
MKILWFTNTPSLYDKGKHAYHGGGWIESLEELVVKEKDIELAISFFHPIANLKIKKNNTLYYPILRKRGRSNIFKTLYNNFKINIESEREFIPKFEQVLDDFKPDIIHMFGTEGMFSSIQKYTNIPIVIHLQGLINPYFNAYFPPNISKWDFLLNSNYFLSNLIASSPYFGLKKMKKLAGREEDNMKNVRFLMGRTNWDKSFCKLYAPNAKYFHIDEVLRDVFYENKINSKNYDNNINIVSTISPTIYKGIDVVLKTAKLFKEKLGYSLNWKLVGLNKNDKLLKSFEKILNINHRDFGIECLGSLNHIDLLNVLKVSNLFVHPSYIDNSPNSVCEAQMIGLPVIACNVGGVSTLIEHRKTGVLVPSNAIIELASAIKEYYDLPEIYDKLAEEGRKTAQKRHDKSKILSELKKVYSTIINT